MPNNDQDYSDNSPSDNSPSEGDPDSEDKQATESGTESNSSSKQEQSAESKTSSSFSDSSSDKPSKKRDIFSSNESAGSPTFPVKLHLILSNPEFEKIVAWLPHGRAWRILDHKALEEKVIPLYFRHGRYSSFARQINGWGFKRIVHGADYNAYYHEMFLRGMPNLCAKMKRPTSKTTSTKEHVDSSDPAPDFYAMSRLQPLPEPGSSKVHPPKDDIIDLEKSVQPLDQDNATGSSENATLEKKKNDVIEQIAQLLNQNSQQQQKSSIPSLGGSGAGDNQLSTILSLLNGGQAAAVAPKPAATLQNQPWQQLLAGLGGNNNDGAKNQQSSNENFQLGNPQAQLAALLQQKLQPQQQPQQQQNPQQLLAALLNNQNSGQNNQTDFLSNLLNQGNSQSSQSSILNNLMNANGQNQSQMDPSNLLQALTCQLQKQQQQQQPNNASTQNQQQSSSQTQQQQQSQGQQQSIKPMEQGGEMEDSSKNKAEDSSSLQGPSKRQRQSQDQDVSTARAQSAQGSTGHGSNHSSDGPNIAALLNKLSGQSGGSQSNATTGALSQLISSMSQKDTPSNAPKQLDFLTMLQQTGQIPNSFQHPKNNNALSNVLSLLQQHGKQSNYMTANSTPQPSPVDALLSALQQQGGQQQKPQGPQDAVAGLLQQILNGSRQGQQVQSSDSSSGRSTGNPVLDALQRLVAPAQPAAPPANNALAQLQQLLAGQSQNPVVQGPSSYAAMQQPSRNGGQTLNSDLLASLGLNQGGNNQTAAMLQQLLNNNNNNASSSQNQFEGSSSNPKPPPAINADFLASLGLSTSGQSFSGTQTPNQAASQPTSNQKSQSGNQSGLNQDFLASLGLSQGNRPRASGSGAVSDRTSSAASGTSVTPSVGQSSSSNGSASVSSDLLNSMGFNPNSQSQGQSSGSQHTTDDSTALSVAAILTAFNKGNNQGN